MIVLRRRQSFPGKNPQEIRCPECGGKARTSEDGILWICSAGAELHLGYYEQPVDVVVHEEKWRP